MKKINDKGFTLIEMLAVVVILGVLALIMVPSVNKMIQENKEQNEKNYENSVTRATQILLSDYRYEIDLENCNKPEEKINVSLNIDGKEVISDGKIEVGKLVEYGYLSGGEYGNDKKIANNATVSVTYSCSKKDYIIQFSSK